MVIYQVRFGELEEQTVFYTFKRRLLPDEA